MSYKLFIPGPVAISDKTYRAMQTPIFGHRSSDFVDLYRSIQPDLKQLFGTENAVYLSTSSAWGLMEGSIRNLVQKKVLNCTNGAFSDKWFDVSKRCGKEADRLEFQWGQAIDPEAVYEALATEQYDVITLVHNETSTGTMSPLAEIMAIVRKFPNVISVVDTVSSFSAVPIPKDELGIDVMLLGTQKALALPPGLALFSASKRAHERAQQLGDRGYYFDFIEFQKNHEKGMTPSTPVIPLIHALKSKLEDIFTEGLQARYARHARLNAKVHAWVQKNGFELFPKKAFASKSLSCIANTRAIDIPKLNEQLKAHYNCVIDGGYGKIKGTTFRISNMGDETDETIDELLGNLDTILTKIT